MKTKLEEIVHKNYMRTTVRTRLGELDPEEDVKLEVDQLLSLFRTEVKAIIGEDEYDEVTIPVKGIIISEGQNLRNNLRAEQRARLAEVISK